MKLRLRGLRNIRTRLALIFAVGSACLLATYAAAVYGLLRQALYRELDRQLESDFKVGEEMMENAERSGGRLRFQPMPAVPQPPDVPPVRSWRWLEIWSPDGQLVYSNPEDPMIVVRYLPFAPPQHAIGPLSVDFADGPHVRMLSRPLVVMGTPVIIRVLRSEQGLRHELWEYSRVLLIALPLAALLVGLGGHMLTKPALAPLVTMAQRAQMITAERLSDRLPVENPNDEIGRLATIFNETLSRLERSFDQLRRFTTDASHELRTPLTALRSVGEVGLRESREPAEYREIIGSLLEEADRLSHLVENLLMLARADSGQENLHLEHLELGVLCREVCELLAVLAEEKHQTIRVLAEQPEVVTADCVALRRAIINLVDNAVKYGPPQSTVTIAVTRRGGAAIVDVIDEGPGIPAGERDRIFDRFYRVDRTRSHPSRGSGLGLSIARAAVEACGGHVDVESQEGQGSTFRITLLASPPLGTGRLVNDRAAGSEPGVSNGRA